MTDETNDTPVEPEVESPESETETAAEPEVTAPTAAADAEATDAEATDAEAPEPELATDAVDADAEIAAPETDDDDDDDDDDEESVAAPAPPSFARTSAPAPVRKRDRKRDPNAPKPIVRAQAKYVRSSARKARLVCDNFRGKSVPEARAILAVTPRAVARDWSKLLESAVANAEHNHDLVGEDLVIKSVQADEGPTIKRFRPRAQGRATRIRKRTSHLTILLTPKD